MMLLGNHGFAFFTVCCSQPLIASYVMNSMLWHPDKYLSADVIEGMD